MTVSYSGSNIAFDDGSTVSSGWTHFKNRIINGAMIVDQRNAGANVASNNNTIYSVDRYSYFTNGSATGTLAQSSNSPVGFSASLLYTITSGSASGASTRAQLIQKIEGYNTADFGWGSVNAKTITLSFWVRSSLTGTFGGTIQNSAQDRSYPFTYTINSANTWEYETITIPGDTSGTWVGATNGTGLLVYWDMGCGSTLQGTAGAWATGDYRGAIGSTSVVATTGATWALTGVQLERGSTASSFEYRPYGQELALCQRYFYAPTNRNGSVVIRISTTTNYTVPVSMRATPTLSVYGVGGWTGGTSGKYDQDGVGDVNATITPSALGTREFHIVPSANVGWASFKAEAEL